MKEMCLINTQTSPKWPEAKNSGMTILMQTKSCAFKKKIKYLEEMDSVVTRTAAFQTPATRLGIH